MIPAPTIIHVVGNRPQFIKLAVLHDAISKHTSFNQYIIHTGQHASQMMSNIFFESLSIPSPDVQLDVREDTPDEFIGKAAAEIFSMLSVRPDEDMVLVYGDTNSTLAAAIAARRSDKKLLHFESGVRTNDKSMPEEINRMLTDRISSVHYCCTDQNKQNLVKEGFGTAIPSEVVWAGDLMLDAFLHVPEIPPQIPLPKNYVACTIHRARNITNKSHLQEIVSALNKIHRETKVIIPLHPHTKRRLQEFGISLECTVASPFTYQEMKYFIHNADFVITDSGGACREAFFAGKKSLIVMESPFWPEIVTSGAALNCKPVSEDIYSTFLQLSSLRSAFDINIFGDGDAARRIASHLNSMEH